MSPARRATLYAIPAAVVAALITFWIISRNLSGIESEETGPVTSVTVTEKDGTADQCAFLVDGLPDTLDNQDKRAVTGHPGSLAYGDPPIVIVCGVDRPEALDFGPQLTSVNGVTWLVDDSTDTSAYGLPGENTLWTCVDREIYIAVAVPSDATGSAVLSPISTTIADRFPSVESAAPSPGG